MSKFGGHNFTSKSSHRSLRDQREKYDRQQAKAAKPVGKHGLNTFGGADNLRDKREFIDKLYNKNKEEVVKHARKISEDAKKQKPELSGWNGTHLNHFGR